VLTEKGKWIVALARGVLTCGLDLSSKAHSKVVSGALERQTGHLAENTFILRQPVDPRAASLIFPDNPIPRSPSRQSRCRIAIKTEVSNNESADSYEGMAIAFPPCCTAASSTFHTGLGAAEVRQADVDDRSTV